MLNFVTRQEIRVEALGAWTSFNDQGIVIEKDFVPVPFNAYRENIWSLAIDIGTESGNIRVFIPPSAPKMTSNHGLLCMGFIDTLNIPA